MTNQEVLYQVRQKILTLPHDEFWNVSEEVGQFLRDLAVDVSAKQILEIGTSSGYSGTWLAEALVNTGGQLYTIESHAKRFQTAQTYFQEAGLTNLITQLKGHAPEIFLENFPAVKIDLAFLDATKHEYGSYLRAVSSILNPKGLVIADNITSHKDALTDFFAAIKELNYSAFLAADFGTGLLAAGPAVNIETLAKLSSYQWQSVT